MRSSRGRFNLLRRWLELVVDPQRILALPGVWGYVRGWSAFRRQHGDMPVHWADTFPKLDDRLPKTPFDPHYFFQGNWLARRLADREPRQHIDVGSSILTVGILSAYVPIVFVDYRPLEARQSGLASVAGDVSRLPFANDSLASLSSLHVIEHIGLGRYGDPIDVHGARRAAMELQRVLGKGGRLYLSTPIGRERVCFNAHRVFSVETVVTMFADLQLAEFSYVDDSGRLHSSVSAQGVPPLDYGCGLFEFVKP